MNQHAFQPDEDQSASCFFCHGYITDPVHNNVTVGPRVFNVPEHNIPLLQERIGKLNKRAAKLGCSSITVTLHGSKDIPIKDRYDPQVIVAYRKVYEITVEGQAPKINGWEFIAVIEPTVSEDGKVLGNILRAVPGASCEVPLQYRNAGNNCDHCKSIRKRNETFILHNDAGDTKQVGRNCLRDFLGHANPEMYCSMAEMLRDAMDYAEASEGDDFGGGARHIDRYMPVEILALAACSVRLNGWRSNTTARTYGTLSTSGEVNNWLFSSTEDQKKWEKPLMPSDEDKATANEVVAWLAKLSERTTLNDYMYNLSILGQGAMLTGKNFGLACSAIPTYLREMEQEINRRKRFADDKESEYVGTIGKREKFTLTLVFTRDFESDFGVSHFYKFKDEAGNVVVWFASSVYWNPATQQDINIGDTITVNATVKRQSVYEDIKQTQVNRCTEWKEKTKRARKASPASCVHMPTEVPEHGDVISATLA